MRARKELLKALGWAAVYRVTGGGIRQRLAMAWLEGGKRPPNAASCCEPGAFRVSRPEISRLFNSHVSIDGRCAARFLVY